MKTIDTTLFSQDFLTLEIRLRELWDEVDIFLVCESTHSFSGKSKKLFLTEGLDRFRSFKKKLRVLVMNQLPHPNPWFNEMRQRQYLTLELMKMGIKNGDIVIHSDCDEIPRAEVVASAKDDANPNYLLEFRNYTYFLNLRNGIYARGRIVSGSNFKSIQHMRRDIFLYNLNTSRKTWNPFIRVPEYWTTRSYLEKLPQLVLRRPRLKYIPDAGWHFNNLLSPKDILNKIEWSAHQELNTKDIANIKHIQDSIRQGRELYRGTNFYVEPIDDSMPKAVLENQDVWRSYISK